MNNNKTIPEKVRAVFKILNLKPLKKADLRSLNNEELTMFWKRVSFLSSQYKGADRDFLFKNLDAVLPDKTKNVLWQSNHYQISSAFKHLSERQDSIPSSVDIAEYTGLTRSTVHTHLEEFSENPLYDDIKGRIKMMGDTMLNNIYKRGLNGDMNAAKLFLKVSGALKPDVNQMIQVNNYNLTKEELQKFEPKKLEEIHGNIIKILEDGKE